MKKNVVLLAVILAMATPMVSYAQLGNLKAKAIEKLTDEVMKALEKKLLEQIDKESISAAAKTNIVKTLCDIAKPIVVKTLDSATSGKLPKANELVNDVLKDILPRVPALVAAAKAEVGGDIAAMLNTGQPSTDSNVSPVAGQASTNVANAPMPVTVTYDPESDFTTIAINNGSASRITKYTGKNTEIKIPPSIENRPVTEIGEQAFMKKGLTSVAIPNSVIFIGNMAFADNQINSVSIGANVYIADNAFESVGNNASFATFYNSQGRKAGSYVNGWRLASAAPSAGTQTNVTPVEETQADTKVSGVQNKPIDPVAAEDAKLWSLGFSLGSTFAAPLYISTLRGTIAPWRNSFFEAGMDVGWNSADNYYDYDYEYFSLYPYVNCAFYLPFPRTASGKRFGGWYIGAGFGVMFAAYTFDDSNSDWSTVWDTTFAMNYVTGFNLFDFLNISYTFRTNYQSYDYKLSVGYAYRFK